MSFRRWWIAALAVALLGAAGLVVATRGAGAECPNAAVPPAQVPPVFASLDAPLVRTDGRLQRLIGAVQGSGLGRVLGAVGYDEAYHLRTAALPDGFATWTADNAVVGFRSPSGVVRWGLRQSRDPQAWAVVGSAFLNLDLRPTAPLQVVAYRATSGAVAWCATTDRPTKVADPLTVAAGEHGSTWLVSAGPTLTHLDASGRVRVQQAARGIDRGTFVKQVGSLLLVGGRASSLLTAPDARIPASTGPVLSALDAVSLRPRWTWGRGRTAHVIGEAEGLIVIEVADRSRLSLVAIDLTGRQRWRVALPAGTTADTAWLPSWRTVLVRSERAVSAYDLGTGSRRWTHALGIALPDGFDLRAQPQIGSRLLLGATTALVLVNASGRMKQYSLPRASTDFWPYEIAVSGRDAVLETNVGAVLIALSAQV